MKRLKIYKDTWNWVFPLALHLMLVGNRHRIYTISIDILCFRIILCVDKDSF